MCGCLFNAEIWGKTTSGNCSTIIDFICKLPILLQPFLPTDEIPTFWKFPISVFDKIGIRFVWTLSTLY